MVDEAHTRSIDNDVLFGLLKKIIQKRQDLRIVIASATVLFLAYCHLHHHLDEC